MLTHEKEKGNMVVSPYKGSRTFWGGETVFRLPLSCRLGRFASCSHFQKCSCAVTMRQKIVVINAQILCRIAGSMIYRSEIFSSCRSV